MWAFRGMIHVKRGEKASVFSSLEHDLGFPNRSTAGISKDLVELVQTSILGLRDEPVDICRGEYTHQAEEDVCAVWCGGDKVGSAHRDCEIVEPVGTGTDGYTLGSESERVHFSDDDPGAGESSVTCVSTDRKRNMTYVGPHE